MKECELCEKGLVQFTDVGGKDINLTLSGNFLSIEDSGGEIICKINYCPICGRELFSIAGIWYLDREKIGV